ncbi:zinc finger protein 607 [Oncorhynchus mykiss]|uniref:C2H2-type domain-containing protein n=1 Tax=Oncorhynchus mykiss TaxID=8022 RepID=A0A8C7RWX8_ONCMY|nr:zinc finger protein 607 [Oncorhynchus mykiss]XP_021439372.2 zinc finger protein 607 [Oncorhynchus mykiss]XP_021439373.2 zinc finger protein 607 [Oncorhynchus mykiss]
MSEAILTFQYQLNGVMETVLKTAVHEITRLVKDSFLEEVTWSKQEVDVLKERLQQCEQRWRDGEEERKRAVEEREQKKKREECEPRGMCRRCGCAGDTEEREKALLGAEEGCAIKQEMLQPGGPSTLSERECPQEMATPSSSCVSERMEERVVHIKEESDDWGDLVTQMITSPDSPMMSLSHLQRLSSHPGGWTSEPLPPAQLARDPPPLTPAPWNRKEQHLLPRSLKPTQGTEHAVVALETSPNGLSINTMAELGVKPFSCPHCGKSFPQLRNLKHHQKYHHTGKKAFTCSQCGKGFVYMSHFRVHMQRHTGDRPFSCSQCGKSFSLQSGLKKHRVIHTAEIPYVVEIKY